MSRVIKKLNKEWMAAIYEKEASRFDATVRIGGSIFIEGSHSRTTTRFEKCRNLFIIGANFGPFNSQSFFENKERQIRHSVDCCFRDLYSYNLFRQLQQVRYAPDALFGYPYLPLLQEGEHVGISVMDFTGRPFVGDRRAVYENCIAEVCDYWTGLGKQVKLYSFCELEGDGIAAERIRSLCQRQGSVTIIRYTGDMDPFLEDLNSCNIIYATRFHAMILGWAMNKKVVPLIYSLKQKHVLEDIQYSGALWDIYENEPLGKAVLHAQTHKPDSRLLEKLTTDSQAHFAGLDEFFA